MCGFGQFLHDVADKKRYVSVVQDAMRRCVKSKKGEKVLSVVVAIKSGNKVFVGADSQVTRGSSRLSLSNPNNYKIWKVKGVDNCIMGHVGVVRDACVIRVSDGIVREIDILKNNINYENVRLF